MANTKVTGDLIASSTIATGNIADNAVTSDKISGITTAHITEGANLYYTDARADARAALLVDSAPSTLNTLNELAAALGDDPNFATTVTNSIATKLPLAGGTLTGNLNAKNILFSTSALPAANNPGINLRDTNNEFYIQSGSAHIFNFIRYDNRNSMMNLESTGINVTGGGTFSGNVTGVRGFFNSGATNVVATFTSTDGTATLQCADPTGNVEFGASGNNFVVQPAGGVAQLTVGSSSSTFASPIYLLNTSARISAGGSGEVGFNYNTGATGSLVWYGGGTASKFNVTNAGNATFAGGITISKTSSADLRLHSSTYSADFNLISGATGANKLGIYDNNGSAYRLLIDSSGKMTIPAIANGINFEITSSAGSNHSIIEMGQVGSDGFLDVSAAGGNIVTHLSGYNGYASYFASPVGIGTTEGTGGFNVNNSTTGSYYNMSNADSGNYKYTNPGGRLLTSNATGWVGDGRDPILTLSSAGNGGATTVGYSLGLNLYSNTATNNTYSPLICFSNLSNSGNYATAYAAIGGKKTGAGTDSNWSAGELHFWTAGPAGAGTGSYMQQASAMMIDDAGDVGIGTNSPQRRLHVNGTEGVARFTSTASGNNGFEVGIGVSSQAFLWQSENAHMELATNNTERMRITSGGKTLIGISGEQNAGHLQMQSGASENGGILDIAGGGWYRYYTRVCRNATTAQAAGYWHIKTNILVNSNTMFMAKFYGYIYGGAQIVELTHAGYAYSGSNTVINQATTNNGSDPNANSVIYSSSNGNKVTFRIAFGLSNNFSTYFAGVMMDIAFPNPTGQGHDFEIEAQSFSTSGSLY